MSDNDDESNPFAAPDLDSRQVPSDSPGVLPRLIGVCMTASLFFLGTMLPCGLLVRMQMLPGEIFVAVALLFFGLLMVSVLLTVIMGVGIALSSVFFRRDAPEERS